MRRLIFFISLVVLATANPARAGQTINLSGTWRFERDDHKVGLREKWFAGPLAGDATIRLPGTMDEAGLGIPNPRKPTLAGLYEPFVYEGAAWYQRDINIPESWRGQRLTLFLERCRWVTTVWLDGRPMGTQDSLVTPHRFTLGLVAGEVSGAPSTGLQPGHHTLTLRVDNTPKINLGTFVSALYGGVPGNLNGVVGRIELRATPPVWLENVEVYPVLSDDSLRVEVRVGNATREQGHGMVSIAVKDNGGPAVWKASRLAAWSARGGGETTLTVFTKMKPWDEFSPNLYKMTVVLDALATGLDERHLQVGLRQLARRGTQFTMNGRPLFLRGTLDCQVFPLTGYPPCKPAPWRRIFRIEKSYGLNFIRFHSWCPPDAAFTAADEAGIMIQVEAPQANVPAGSDPARDRFTEHELMRMVHTYGNHPSFCLMTLGNEYGGKPELLNHWVDMLIKADPRHLYSSPSAGQTTPNRQWTENTFGRGVHGPGTDRDVSQAIAHETVPPVGHEIGQWTFFPNLKEMKKYTGVFEPRNFEIVRDDLRKKGMLDLAGRFFKATGMQAVLLYKEEIELLRRTPGFAGFSLLDLHDYPGQGTALVGPLDPFWDSKGFITPAAFRRFCGPSAPLLRMPKRAYWADETFTAKAEFANFGPHDLSKAQPFWQITDEHGHEIASGHLAELNIPTGRLSPLGVITASLSMARPPCKLTVTVGLKGAKISSDWNIWVYPPGPAPQPPDGLVVSHAWDDATKAALATGRRVLLFPSAQDLRRALPGRFLPVFWSPVWFPSQRPNTMGILCNPKNPLFARFPTEFYSDWQWWYLINRSHSIVLDDTPASYRPLVQVIDNFSRNHKLASVFQARVGPGRLMVCALNLDDHDGAYPAVRQFARSLYAYLASPAFKPRQRVDASTLDRIFSPPQTDSTLVKLGARVLRADSAAPGYPASQAIDGDPDTFWHTVYEPAPALMPHELVIDIGSPILLRGMTYLPRQDMANGRIARFELYASAHGKTWGQPLARGTWANTSRRQTVLFHHPVRARYLRIVAQSEVHGNAFTSAAEFDVLTNAPSAE
jgi:F5/8 type C domain/Glycosyl hydrolases family 2, sugar binding domain/Glycosyl hydrolases family 2